MKLKKCEMCSNEFTSSIKKRTCSKTCYIELLRKLLSGKNNPAYGKAYRTKKSHPEWALKVSNTHKERGTLVGDKNPMKNKETAKKMSETRIKNVTSSIEYRKARSESVRNLWKAGFYKNVKVGRCKWYDYVKKDGSVVKCQGLWEFEYAKYLDNNNIKFFSHVDYFNYIDDEGISRTYHPDFKLYDGTYIDIKNKYYEKIHSRKIELVRQQNKDIKLLILGYEQLRKLDIKLSGCSNKAEMKERAVIDE